MKITENGFILEDIFGINPSHEGIRYSDITNVGVFVPAKVIVHLYSMLKWHVAEKNNLSEDEWEVFEKDLFDGDHK